jgi:two-component system sensor histidine kinase RpfC
MKPARPPRLPAFAQRLVQRVRSRPDSEFQQSFIRVAIGLIFLVYFSSDLAALSLDTRTSVLIISALFTCVAAALSLLVLSSTNISPLRRIGAMLLDYSTCSYLLVLSGEAGSPLLVVYLWVTLGNGFRYGAAYLYAAAAMAVTGFALVLTQSAYWSQHLSIGVGFLLSMIAVPLYSASLLRQMHTAIQRERAANQAKSSFLANMSHELRTPLNGVIGVVDLLADTQLDKEQQEFTQIIRTSANTLLDLVDNVLDISRIESGRLSSSSEDFDLHRLVNGTIAMMESQASGKGLTLAVHIAPQTPFQLYGDARHVRQVLINLIGNAIKFTEHGRVDVYVRPMGQGHPQRLRFEVVDTGIGIAEDAQARVFERFTQADSSVTRRYGGTGLGTTIAKQLVEMLGGQIGLHSRLGEGSTFWFELPFAVQTAEAQAKPQAHFDVPMRVAILAGSELAARVQNMVRGWGAEAVAVGNTARLAAELSAYLTGGLPLGAVVVERSALPGDPVEFLRLLRDDPSLATLPVILIADAQTAGGRDGQMLQAGFASVLGTPVNATLLFNAIHAVVSQDLPKNVVSLVDRFQSQSGLVRRLRILVAEDNPVNQRVLRGLLEHAGHEAFLAHDGEEALAMLESDDNSFDLAIIDMHMPQLSGPEVVQRWRFMENGRLPIIMLTADAREEAEHASAEAGADIFLTKPVNSRELIDVIARLAHKQPAGAAPSHSPPAAHAITLDESILEDLARLGGTGFVQELVNSFGEDSLRSINEVERALITQDYSLWHDQLHMLKGGASDMGACQLARLCSEAERIKPFEIASPAARQKLDAVRLALTDAQAALAAYTDRKLRAENV